MPNRHTKGAWHREATDQVANSMSRGARVTQLSILEAQQTKENL